VIEALEVFVLEPHEAASRLEAVLLPKAAKEQMQQQGGHRAVRVRWAQGCEGKVGTGL